jgi:hypothetical protein
VPLSAAPPPSTVGNRRVLAPDVERVSVTLRFDIAAREAEGEARVDFVAGEVDGHAALDLRQDVEWLRLDGEKLDPSAWAPADLGGGTGAEMRVLDVSLEAGSRHRLEVGYTLDTPAAVDSPPVGWVDDGVRFDLSMSDLQPGRYLEMWVPAPLVHDDFVLELHVELLGGDRPHTLLANTAGIDAARRGRAWSLCYPAHYTALSPMLVIAPTDLVEVRRSALALPGRERSLGLVCASLGEAGAALAACEADVRSWLAYMASRYGRWVHGDTFWAVIWDLPRGMEYDGATTASVLALEHEVFHSWFGRGVKPARAADGWIDEAFTTWATGSRRQSGLRFASDPLGLDETPIELYPPEPWARRTVAEAYSEGARLFAGIAALLGGPERLRAAMAEWYQINAGRFVTTDGLAAHLTASSGVDVGPWWARYVHGRG